MDRKEYAKAYWQKPEVKEKKMLEQRETYHSDAGQAYEFKRRRTPKSRWMRAKTNARVRKKDFTLTLEYYTSIICNPCKYCNADISMETGSGLDRKDNDKGYIEGNVEPCCKNCNRRRSKSMSSEEFERQSVLNEYKKS